MIRYGRLSGHFLFLFVPMLAALAGCERDENSDVTWFLSECPECSEGDFSTCLDGEDNDQDQLADCLDPDCGSAPHCGARVTSTEGDDLSCSDGIDNDGNGYVDCNDFGCLKNTDVTVCRPPESEPENSLLACSDGLDNDWDNDIDCRDPDCAAFPVLCESSDVACSDGIDNDNNGYLDCQDFNCSKNPDVTVCSPDAR